MASGGENVVIEVPGCSLTLMPAYGGKISSFRVGSHELLQPPLQPYAPRDHAMGFEQSDGGGWDECLPSVAACTVQTPLGPIAVPDHGDLWRVSWQVLHTTADSATMRARCFSLPLELTRSMLLSAMPGGWRLQLLYSLTSLGINPLPWAWAAHPLFAAASGDWLELPPEITAVRLEGSRNNRLGTAGATIPWPSAPVAHHPDHTRANRDLASHDFAGHDLSRAHPATSGFGDKLFAGPFTLHAAGWCTIHRPSVGLKLTIRFDPAQTPWLGLWLCYGGWPENTAPSAPKQVCIAPEPSTAPVDSLAAGDAARILDAGETISWSMDVEVELLGRS